jgi:hypothetical protein
VEDWCYGIRRAAASVPCPSCAAVEFSTPSVFLFKVTGVKPFLELWHRRAPQGRTNQLTKDGLTPRHGHRAGQVPGPEREAPSLGFSPRSFQRSLSLEQVRMCQLAAGSSESE